MPQGFETRPATEYFAAKQSVPNMDVALVSASPTMPAATLCNLPLSTTFDHNLEKSLSSLEWVLTSRVPAVSGPFSLPYCDGAVDTVFVSKYSCWLPPFFYLTLFLAVTGIIFVETREACVYLASGVLRFTRCHEVRRSFCSSSFPLTVS
jgi:hypothetical protein